MAILQCAVAERLLRAYLKALEKTTRVCNDYARAARRRSRSSLAGRAEAAAAMAERLAAAREALQRHQTDHGCHLPKR